jgi:hypothetical protein
MKNNETRSTGSTLLPKGNDVRPHNLSPRRGCGCGCGRDHGHIHGRNSNICYDCNFQNKVTKNNDNHQKWAKNNEKGKGKDAVSTNYEDKSYRCSMKGHWYHTCRTTKHIADLYQASFEKKGKDAEAHFTQQHFLHDDDDDTNLEDHYKKKCLM